MMGPSKTEIEDIERALRLAMTSEEIVRKYIISQGDKHRSDDPTHVANMQIWVEARHRVENLVASCYLRVRDQYSI